MLSRLRSQFGDRELASLATEEILSFITELTEGTRQSTKRLSYSILSAFFNFIKNSLDPTFQNPCDTVILRKFFKKPKPRSWKILEKEVIDEIIFRTEDSRNRLMLELMARLKRGLTKSWNSKKKIKGHPSGKTWISSWGSSNFFYSTKIAR